MKKLPIIISLLVILCFGCKKNENKVVITPENKADSATIYIGTSNSQSTSDPAHLYAINVFNGTVRWEMETYGITSPVTFFDNTIYYCDHTALSGSLTAMDPINRNVKWKYQVAAAICSTPTVVNGVVYFNCNDLYMYAVNASNGILLWKYFLGPYGITKVLSSPTVVNGVVYTGATNHNIQAINVGNGTLKWKFQTSSTQISIDSGPCVVNDVVYVGDSHLSLLALDATDGSVKWYYQANDFISSSPTVTNGIVYFGSKDGYVYALDATTGAFKWKYNTGSEILASPIIKNDILYIGNTGPVSSKFQAFNALTGDLKWSYTSNQKFYGSPVVFNGMVIVADQKHLYAFNAESGAIIWNLNMANLPGRSGEELVSSATIIDFLGNLYQSGVSGDVQ